MKLVAVIMWALMLFGASARAETITAVCREPVGRILGVAMTSGRAEPIDAADGMKGGLFTVIWTSGAETAQVVSQGSGGGAPNAETGIRVLVSDEQVSFLVLYESAVWLYSLFPTSRTLLITSHNNGSLIGGGAINKSFRTPCEISRR